MNLIIFALSTVKLKVKRFSVKDMLKRKASGCIRRRLPAKDEPQARLELATYALRMRYSTN